MTDPRDRDARPLRGWGAAAALAAAALAAAVGGDAARAALRYERGLLLEEPWRLITGNLVHLGAVHLVLNLVGLALVAALARGAVTALRAVTVLLGAMLGVGLGLWWLSPSVGWYVGLSGALHGLLAWTALALCGAPATRVLGVALAAMLAAKLGAELALGSVATTAALIGAPVVSDAHLYGAFGGLLGGGVGWCFDRLRSARGPRV